MVVKGAFVFAPNLSSDSPKASSTENGEGCEEGEAVGCETGGDTTGDSVLGMRAPMEEERGMSVATRRRAVGSGDQWRAAGGREGGMACNATRMLRIAPGISMRPGHSVAGRKPAPTRSA